jgi:hypothetical protein
MKQPIIRGNEQVAIQSMMFSSETMINAPKSLFVIAAQASIRNELTVRKNQCIR